MTFGEKLKVLREKAGMSQDELAKLAGCTQQAINNWETGQRAGVSLKYTQGLCRALGVKCTIFDGCTFPKAKKES